MKSARLLFAGLRARVRVGIAIEGAACIALVCAVFVFASYGLDRGLHLETGFRLGLLIALGTAIAYVAMRRLVRPMQVHLDDDEVALALERSAPDLHQRLISAVQFERGLAAHTVRGDSPALMQSVIDEVSRTVQSIDPIRALDGRRVLRYLGLLVLGLGSVTAWAAAFPDEAALWAQRSLGLSSRGWPRLTHLSFVDLDPSVPVRLAEREDLTVRIRADGVVPESAQLRGAFAGGESIRREMDRTADNEFTAKLEEVLEDCEVRAVGGDGETATLRVVIVPRPRVTDLAVVVHPPAYLGLDDESQTVETGVIEIPAGASLTITGASSKPLQSSALRLPDGTRIPAVVAAPDRLTFAVDHQPAQSMLIAIEVVDDDALGPVASPQIDVLVIADTEPDLEFDTIDLSGLITPFARIPGTLRLRDDHGVRELIAEMRLNGGGEPSESDASTDEQVYEPAPFAGLEHFEPGVADGSLELALDLLPFHPESADPDAEVNRVRPGMSITLRFSGIDAGQGTGRSEAISLRVVTAGELIEDVRRRQLEQRQELENLRLRELRARADIAGFDPSDPNTSIALRGLASQQLGTSNKIGSIAARYASLLRETLNNRVFEPDVVRDLTGNVVRPLERLVTGDLATSVELVERFAEAGTPDLRQETLATYDRIITQIERVLEQMERSEDIAAFIEALRVIIRIQNEARGGTEAILDSDAGGVFRDEPPAVPKPVQKPGEEPVDPPGNERRTPAPAAPRKNG